jgi:hypothetical protein
MALPGCRHRLPRPVRCTSLSTCCPARKRAPLPWLSRSPVSSASPGRPVLAAGVAPLGARRAYSTPSPPVKGNPRGENPKGRTVGHSAPIVWEPPLPHARPPVTRKTPARPPTAPPQPAQSTRSCIAMSSRSGGSDAPPSQRALHSSYPDRSGHLSRTPAGFSRSPRNVPRAAYYVKYVSSG